MPLGAATGLEAEDGDSRVLLRGQQVTTARTLVEAAKALGLGKHAALIAVVASWQQTALTTPAALSPDHTPSPRSDADPARSLLRQVAGVQGWQASRADLVADALLKGTRQDAGTSSTYVPVAAVLTSALWDPGRTTALDCGPAGGAGPGGEQAGAIGGLAPEACSVRPDPTTDRGCLTPRTAVLAAQLLGGGWQVLCWDPHLWNPSSDHPQGRACDVTIGQAGRYPRPTDKARGDALAHALQVGAAHSGIDYLIWSGRIWSSARAHQGWRPYTGGGVYDALSPTGGHYDHVHISMA